MRGCCDLLSMYEVSCPQINRRIEADAQQASINCHEQVHLLNRSDNNQPHRGLSSILALRKADFILGGQNATLSKYPDCSSFYSGSNPEAVTVVKADLLGSPEQTAAAIGVNFGASYFIAQFLHAVAVEIYVSFINFRALSPYFSHG